LSALAREAERPASPPQHFQGESTDGWVVSAEVTLAPEVSFGSACISISPCQDIGIFPETSFDHSSIICKNGDNFQ
jgi:hypothetical protein